MIKFLLLAAVFLSAGGQAGELAKFHARVKGTTSLAAGFTQTQKIKEFKNPVVSRGNFIFQAPGKLRWVVLSPYNYIMLVKDKKITISYPKLNHVESRDLAEDKITASVAASMSAFFQGDLDTLNSRYEVSIDGGENGKTLLTLVPKSSHERRTVKNIKLRFTREHIESIEIYASGGGETIINFSSVQVNPTLDDRLFTIR